MVSVSVSWREEGRVVAVPVLRGRPRQREDRVGALQLEVRDSPPLLPPLLLLSLLLLLLSLLLLCGEGYGGRKGRGRGRDLLLSTVGIVVVVVVVVVVKDGPEDG